MTLQDVYSNVNRNTYKAKTVQIPVKYDSDHVFDENKSVKWNREEAARLNAEREALLQQNRWAENEASTKFQNDLILAVEEGFDLSYGQAKLVFNHAWEDGHSGGYSEVVNYAGRYAEFAREILDNKPASC